MLPLQRNNIGLLVTIELASLLALPLEHIFRNDWLQCWAHRLIRCKKAWGKPRDCRGRIGSVKGNFVIFYCGSALGLSRVYINDPVPPYCLTGVLLDPVDIDCATDHQKVASRGEARGVPRDSKKSLIARGERQAACNARFEEEPFFYEGIPESRDSFVKVEAV